MDCVITLSSAAPLDPGLAARVVETVRAVRADRLGDTAMDVHAPGEAPAVRAQVAPLLADHAVDSIVQPAATRAKRLLMSDMDSTLIGQECIDELAAVTGKKAEVAAITERAMAGELDFADALRARVAVLAGIPEAAVAELLERVITPNPGAADLIARCRAAGVRTVLVSGGFTLFAQPVAERLGMDAAFANTLEVESGMLTGRVTEPILGADAKRERLEAECTAFGFSLTETVALGDGANDVRMIEAAGLGVAYRAKPALARAAHATLDHAPLSAVADAMGLPPLAAREVAA